MSAEDAHFSDARMQTIRDQFAPLDSGWRFFDNAGGTLTAQMAIDACVDYMRLCPVQLGASYAVSQTAAQYLGDAHRAAAELFDETHAGQIDDEQIVFGASSTALFNQLAAAMADQLDAGDRVIVTNVDHEANIGAWRRLADKGVDVVEWQVDPDTFNLSLETLDGLLTGRTKLVAFTHCSNVLGSALPVAEITRRAHAAGARVCVDGVAYAPHRSLHVVDWDVDFYVFSLYKVFSPHNAVLYGKKDALLPLANRNHFFYDRSMLPGKLQPGAYGYEQAYATTGVTRYLREVVASDGNRPGTLGDAFAAITRHEAALVRPLIEYVTAHPKLRLIGASEIDDARLPTCAFVIEDRPSDAIIDALDQQHFAVRFGHFYALRLIRALGLESRNGVVRVSLSHYNSRDEIDALTVALDRILADTNG